MLARCFCILLLSGSFVFANAQVKEDSIIRVQYQRITSLLARNIDSALLLTREQLKKAETDKNDLAIGNAWLMLGGVMINKGYWDSAAFYSEKARERLLLHKSAYSLVLCNTNLVHIYINTQKKLQEAFQLLLQADSICIKNNNDSTFIRTTPIISRQMGEVYEKLGEHKNALKYLQQAKNEYLTLGSYDGYFTVELLISGIYRHTNMPDSVIAVMQRALTLAKGKLYPLTMGYGEYNLAEAHFALKNYTNALAHYQAAYNIYEKMDSHSELVAYQAMYIGKTLSMLNRYTEAEKYLLRANHFQDTFSSRAESKYDITKELANFYQKTGKWQKAFTYLQEATQLKDSLNVADQLKQANELKEKYESEKREKEITLLTTKNQLAESANRQTRLRQYIFLLLFLAAVIVAWLLLNRFKMKKKMENEQLRNRIASDLHDDIGSALSSIDINSRIALMKKDDNQSMLEHLQRIQQYTRNTMDSMGDIVWSIHSQEADFETVLARMRQFASELCEPLNIDFRFNIAAEAERISFSPQKRKCVFLLFKEAINNAAKYSNCTMLTIDCKLSGNNFEMKIKDNGKGFDEETVKKGNGLKNMRERAEKNLKGEIDIHSSIGKGTTIVLRCLV